MIGTGSLWYVRLGGDSSQVLFKETPLEAGSEEASKRTLHAPSLKPNLQNCFEKGNEPNPGSKPRLS
ncbi:hypothetical protein LguiB_013220 [Lonicera macranthoides]